MYIVYRESNITHIGFLYALTLKYEQNSIQRSLATYSRELFILVFYKFVILQLFNWKYILKFKLFDTNKKNILYIALVYGLYIL